MLLYENLNIPNKKAFISRVKAISTVLNINPNWLMFIMNFESGGTFSSSIRNPYSGGVGLIQFMPNTALGLGTTCDALARMTNVEQLDFVYSYYAPYKGRIKNGEDMYLITFFPIALGQSDSYVFQSANLSAWIIAKQNPSLNLDGDGKITMKEWKRALREQLESRVESKYIDEFYKKKK